MKKKKISNNRIIYTILSVLALSIVVVGIVFAWKSYNDGNDPDDMKEDILEKK